MRKQWHWAVLLLLLCLFPGHMKAEEPAGWTVMFYFCGSDLESKYGFASENLMEITECLSPSSMLPELALRNHQTVDPELLAEPAKVNVVIETGGSRAWKMDSLMDIDADHLQRWHFDPEQENLFSLDETLELKSMADPESLADFIQWGARTYPAERYALVLWDHGGGSKTGLLIDELFQNDVMNLPELQSAFQAGSIHFDAVLMDACMMANLETACAIHEYADYLIASEELVAGQGTAINLWLQELYNNPTVDGLGLGRNICEMTQIKYANLDNAQARDTMTWSVIDLSRIEAVLKNFDTFYRVLLNSIIPYPELVRAYVSLVIESDEYGNGRDAMHDLACLFYESSSFSFLDYRLRTDMLQSLREAVVYAIHGPGRATARGLSFCCALGFNHEELDRYAINCPSANYLAFLDAISDWEAPERVYETAMRAPEISGLDEYQIILEKRLDANGFPCLFVSDRDAENIREIGYELLQKKEDDGQFLSLGSTICTVLEYKEHGVLYMPEKIGQWSSVDNVLCCMNLVKIDYVNNCFVFEIPIQIGREEAILRCGRLSNRLLDSVSTADDEINQYTVYGVWDGYDDDTDLPNRNVQSLAQLAGREYQILYPVITGSEEEIWHASGPLTMYRSLEVKETSLPAGSYEMDYMVNDIFGRTHVVDTVKMYWDGQTVTFPEDLSWTGKVIINPVLD